MSKNSLLKFVVAFGLLAILLAFLGVNYVPRISASSSTSGNLVDASIQARQNYVNERYPRSLAPQLSTAGSDYFERHSVAVSQRVAIRSDFLNHHPFAVSQRIAVSSEFLNHHPFVVIEPLNLATPATVHRVLALSEELVVGSVSGNDQPFTYTHPLFVGSDSIERRTSFSFSNSNWFEHNR